MQLGNPVGRLKELAEALSLQQPSYSSELVNGSWSVKVHITVSDSDIVSASGHAGDKRQAKADASGDLLIKLERLGISSQQAAPARFTHRTRLQELLTCSSRGLRAVYTECTLAGSPGGLWQSTVHIVCPSGITLLTASAIHSTKVGSREVVTAKVLASKQLYTLALAEASPAVAAAAQQAEVQVITESTATAVALPSLRTSFGSNTAIWTAADSGHEGKLQELLQIAASKCVEGWAGQLPVYTTSSSGPPHSRQHTVQVSISGPAGAVLTAVSMPMSSKKRAEQAAAAEMLQTSVLQQLQTTLQRSLQLSKVTETCLQRLHHLVHQTAWCMEDITHVQVSNGQGSGAFQASIIINGFLLGRAWSSSKSGASQAASRMALASMGFAVHTGGAAVVSTPPHQATPKSALPTPQTAVLPNHHASIPAPPVIAVQCRTPPVAYQLPPAWHLQGENSSQALSASSSTAGAHSGHDPAAASVFASNVQHLSLRKFNELVVSALVTRAVCTASADRTVVSAFLLQQGNREPEVIALGSGTYFCSLPDQCISSVEQRGRLLLDSHAEVIARRSLLRWLYQQSQTALQVAARPGSIAADTALEFYQPLVAAGLQDNSCWRLRLKPGYRLHMYISRVPCGDATMLRHSAHSSSGNADMHFTKVRPRLQLAEESPVLLDHQHSQQQQRLPAPEALTRHWPLGCVLLNPTSTRQGTGKLRGKVLAGETYVPLPTVASPSTTPGTVSNRHPDSSASDVLISSNSTASSLPLHDTSSSNLKIQHPIRKVCCSDKLARFNALGLQGALLGQWLEPVYVSSITIGGPASAFCEGVVSRAVCCRLAPDLPQSLASGSGCQSYEVPARQLQSAATCKQHIKAREPGDQKQVTAPRMATAVARGLRLPAPYRVNHPQLYYAATVAGVPTPGGHGSSGWSANESLNWNAAEHQLLEVTNGSKGVKLALIHLDSPAATFVGQSQVSNMGPSTRHTTSADPGPETASRLSKVELFKCYQQFKGQVAALGTLQQRLQQQAGIDPSGSCARGRIYAVAKSLNVGYLAAKQKLYQHFEQTTGQSWLRRSALLPELELWWL